MHCFRSLAARFSRTASSMKRVYSSSHTRASLFAASRRSALAPRPLSSSPFLLAHRGRFSSSSSSAEHLHALPALPDELVSSLATARSAAVISGAGISADSGVPTYRGPRGTYQSDGNLASALSGEVFARTPDVTWKALAHTMHPAMHAKPNAGHLAVADIERKVERFILLTQNVDGLHQDAGSSDVIEIHGSARRLFCLNLRCDWSGALTPEIVQHVRHTHTSPRCPRCNTGVIRPDIVLFGEQLPFSDVQRWEQLFYMPTVPDVVIVAGSSCYFPYIQEPVFAANSLKRTTVVIDVDDRASPMRHLVKFFLHGSTSHFLPLIAQALPRTKP